MTQVQITDQIYPKKWPTLNYFLNFVEQLIENLHSGRKT